MSRPDSDDDDYDDAPAPEPEPEPMLALTNEPEPEPKPMLALTNEPRTDAQRIEELRMVLADIRATEAEEERRLALQVDAIVPNASALAMQAANNPSVTRFNVREWFRARLPAWTTAADAMTSTVILALCSLYMSYAGGIASMGLGDPFARPPPPSTLPIWMHRDPLMANMPDGGSVVDEVFAKAEAEAEASRLA